MALQIFFQRCTVNDLWNDVDKNVVHMIGTCHFCVIENFGRCSTPLKNDFWTHDFQNKCRRSNVEKYQTDFLKTRFKVWKGCSKNFHLAIRKKKTLKFVEKKTCILSWRRSLTQEIKIQSCFGGLLKGLKKLVRTTYLQEISSSSRATFVGLE